MSVSAPPRYHTYGGWRRSRSLGVAGLDSRQTVMVVGAVMIPLGIASLLGLGYGLWLVPPALVVIALAVLRRDGVLVMDLAVANTRWRWAEWRGRTHYRGHIFTEHPKTGDLPGALAPTQLLEAEEPGRGTVGVVWNTATGKMSATLLLSPAGALLADAATVNRQVASWGALLASLSDNPAIVHAAVTIELQPESGAQLGDHVTGRLDPSAPPLARQVLTELVQIAPQGSSRVSARLTLTVDPVISAARPRSIPDAVAEVIRSLGGLSVASAGADVLRRATGTDLIKIVRSAYDPDVAASSRFNWEQLTWSDAGPVSAHEAWDHYRHDGGYSLSWALLEAPRQKVSHDVLLPLLSPGRWPRRVTLAYRTLSREAAGAVLEREVNAAAAAAEYRRRTKRDSNARDRADAERAAQAAAEEAAGAGLVQFSLYVTTTVADSRDLIEARREVEQAAGNSRLKLRLARGGQAALFAAGLPCGVYPPDL